MPTLMGVMAGIHKRLFLATNGRLFNRMAGMPVLMLTVTGRKSGKQHTTPLTYLRDGADYVVIASAGGAAKDPAWWLNLRANPRANILVDGKTITVTARRASNEEYSRIWPKLPSHYGMYQSKTDRQIPIVLLAPA